MEEISGIKELLEEDFGKYPTEKVRKGLMELFEKNKEDENKKETLIAEASLINDIFTSGNQIQDIWDYCLNQDKLLFPLKENKEWKEEYLDYYKKRYHETKSPFVKSRYAFAVLTLLKGQDRFSFSRECFDSWLEGTKFIYQKLKEGYKNNILDYGLLGVWTSIGIRLIVSLDMKEKVGDMVDFIGNLLEDEQEELLKLNFLEEIVNFMDNLSVYEEDKIDALKENIENFCNNQIEIYSKQNLFPTVERYARLLSEIKPGYNSEIIIAKNFEKDAESREQPLIRCHLLEKAIKEYQFLQDRYPDEKEGINKKIEDLKEKISEESKKIEYKKFGHEIEIKKEEIDRYVKQYEKKGELFEEFIKSSDFIPKISEVKKQNDFLIEKNPSSLYIPHAIISRFGPISKCSSEEEIRGLKYRSQYSYGIQIYSFYLGSFWAKMEERLGENFYDEIFNLLDQKELSEIKEFLILSINHFKNKDYISSIHVLMPYVEEIIRAIIRKSGNVDNVLKTGKNKFFRKMEFGALIKKEIVKEAIGEDLVEALDTFLLMDDQFNLRNILSHGLISKKECNPHNNVYLIYLVLKLAYILKNLEIENKNEK